MKFADKLKFITKAPRSIILSRKFSTPNILSDSETVDFMLYHQCSVSRFGDGEFNLMRGIDIKFQHFDEELKTRLVEIAEHQSNDRLLICLPNIFTKKAIESFSSEAGKWWHNYLKCTRGYWYKQFRGDLYGDTNITRFYVESANKARELYVKKIKRIWLNKEIIIAEGETTRMGVGNDLFDGAKNIKRIICPAKNAFSSYNKILETVREYATSDNQLIISALGPTATVLSFDLSELGYRALDLGHIDIEYEWFLSRAEEKKAVEGKSMTEVNDFVTEIVDDVYRDQIIEVIQ